MHPDDRASAGAVGRAAAQGRPRLHEFCFRTAAGDYRWVREELRIAGPDGPDGGECCEVVGSWTDITARKAAEDELKRSRCTGPGTESSPRESAHLEVAPRRFRQDDDTRVV